MDLARFFASEFDQHQETVQATRDALAEPFARLVEVCVSSLSHGGKVLFFGNGGSAGDAQHLATELAARYITNPSSHCIHCTHDRYLADHCHRQRSWF